MTPSGVKSLIFGRSSSRSLLSFSVLLLIMLLSTVLLPSETEARKVSRYNRKEFREYLALKRRASEAERRAYYDQQLRVYNVCPQGFYKATDGKCYLNVPSTSRFQSVVPHRRFVRTPQHFGRNPFQSSWRQPAPSVSRIQRSPEQHGRHRFGHPLPEALRQRRSPLQHGRHRFGHPLPENNSRRRRSEDVQHGRHRYGHPLKQARRQQRSPEQHGRHHYGHPIPEQAKRQQ